MRTKAALMWSQPGEWDVREVELDEPKAHEVRVKMMASGLCHSDDHIAKNDVTLPYLPYCGGHEGAGIIDAVGSAVTGVEVGDHVVTTFVPSCGRCRFCAEGLFNLCDDGRFMLLGTQTDGTYRMHCDGQDVGQSSLISTFSQWTVCSERSVVRIPKDIPFTSACLLGCGVPTGWGSSVKAGQVKPNDVVIVMGIGGIGINAVQGAKHCGASHVIAVDPNEFKREMASQLGATATFGHIDEAAEYARSLTNGQGADVAIVTVGVTTGPMVASAFSAIRKAGTCVVTGMGNMMEVGIPVSLFELSMFQKRIQGALLGMGSPNTDVPRLIGLYQSGQLRLDELVTRTYRLEDINQGYADMHAGKNVRGVIVFEH